MILVVSEQAHADDRKSATVRSYEGWNFNSGNYLFTNWYKIDTYFEVLLSFNVVTGIVCNPLPAMWKS